MKTYLTLVLSLAFIAGAWSQQRSELDSMLRLLPKAKKDTSLVLLYYDIGFEYAKGDYSKAKSYYLKAKQLSEEIGFLRGRVLFASYYCNILNAQGEYDSSLVINKEVIKLAEHTKDSIQLAKCYINLGNVFNYKQQYDSAVHYYLKGKSFANHHPRMTAHISFLLGPVYLDLGKKDEAIRQLESSLSYFRKAGDPRMLGQVLLNTGSAYEASGNAEKGRSLLHESLKLAREIGFEELRLHCLVSLMNNYIWDGKGSDPIIEKYAKEALPIAEEQGNKMGMVLVNKALGVHYTFKRQFMDAGKYLDTTLSMADQNEFLEERQDALYRKGLLYMAMGRLEEGNSLLNESFVLKDSILSKETRNQIIMAEERFESEKKEAQILLQDATIQRKNLLNYIFIGSTLGLGMILLLLYRNYRNKQEIQKAKIDELETEKQFLAAQSLLKGQEDERSRLAKDLHDGLGGMLSGVKLQLGAMKGNMIMTEENGVLFNSALNKLDQSIAEMRRVAHNMMPEALLQLGLEQALRDYCESISSAGKFKVSTEFHGLSERMNSSTEVSVYRIVQELVNNAVKHADAENILVQVLKREQSISITVEDDGKGFDAERWEESPTAGLKNILSRVNYLGGSMDIKSVPEKGTSIYIECNG
ncbi:ATP-binding protein [Leadbetterella byssophila]|uniref:ATP-binding protein n=1 Tax=Leadbetterella byssophila TaxID=316068 RepID=UPI00399F61FD